MTVTDEPAILSDRGRRDGRACPKKTGLVRRMLQRKQSPPSSTDDAALPGRRFHPAAYRCAGCAIRPRPDIPPCGARPRGRRQSAATVALWTATMPCGRSVASCSRIARCIPICRERIADALFRKPVAAQGVIRISQRSLILGMSRHYVSDLRLQWLQRQSVPVALPGIDVHLPQPLAVVGQEHGRSGVLQRELRWF